MAYEWWYSRVEFFYHPKLMQGPCHLTIDRNVVALECLLQLAKPRKQHPIAVLSHQMKLILNLASKSFHITAITPSFIGIALIWITRLRLKISLREMSRVCALGVSLGQRRRDFGM
jgi:hypothetical protein